MIASVMCYNACLGLLRLFHTQDKDKPSGSDGGFGKDLASILFCLAFGLGLAYPLGLVPAAALAMGIQVGMNNSKHLGMAYSRSKLHTMLRFCEGCMLRRLSFPWRARRVIRGIHPMPGTPFLWTGRPVKHAVK